MGKAITTQAAHLKAVEELKERATNLYLTYQKGKASIESIYQAGWRDPHFLDLKTQFDKANDYIEPLKEFMDRASDHQKDQEAIINRMNEKEAHRFDI